MGILDIYDIEDPTELFGPSSTGGSEPSLNSDGLTDIQTPVPETTIDTKSGIGSNTKAEVASDGVEIAGTAAGLIGEAISGRKDEATSDRIDAMLTNERDLNEAEEDRQKSAIRRIEEADRVLARSQDSYFKRQKMFEKEFADELAKIQKGADARARIDGMSANQTMMRQMRDSMEA